MNNFYEKAIYKPENNFSGQNIQIAGQTIAVLADTRGGIILAGDQFVWSNTERSPVANHLKIQAKTLGAAAM